MKTKIWVVDDNEEIVNLFNKHFNKSSNIEVIGSSSDGLGAIEALKNIKFDIMILDMVMPNKDGIGVLNYMKENNITKDVIVISSYNQEDFIRMVSKYNVKYYILKPFDINDVEKNIIEIKNNEDENNLPNKLLNKKITNLLHDLGIPSNIKGYQYVKNAILMVYKDPNYIGNITNKLYPQISNKYKTTIQKVERAIRHAIEVAWLRGDIDLMEEIFGHSVDIDKSRPTNSEFIVTIADELKLGI